MELSALASEEVHLWRQWVDLEPHALRPLEDTLSPDEQARAGRYRQARDRRRFVASRGALRQLLGRYASRSASELQFSYGAAGKPALSGSDLEWLRFNVSHSAGLLMIAVADRREVGVDVEEIDERLAWPELCRFLTESQQSAVWAHPPTARRRAFFEAWTLHEAGLKALGRGLGGSDHASDPTLAGWSPHSIDVGHAFAAALVVQGGPVAIRQFSDPPGGES